MNFVSYTGIALAALLMAIPSPRQDDTLEWLDDYGEAIALARETGKPLLVEFRCAP